ncbi:MAG: hypothetical protein JW874_16030 [Spirochaetales bacterium]|nr:hypothetical protein [Spirochaetales bacterium]
MADTLEPELASGTGFPEGFSDDALVCVREMKKVPFSQAFDFAGGPDDGGRV